MNPEIERDEIKYLIEVCGVYDGWSVAVMKDGRKINRWTGVNTRRAEVIDAYLAGEEPNGRWI